jgi:hypothetical protein
VSAADGVVVGRTKLVDHGADGARWCLVITSDGYKTAELPTFHADAASFVDKLFATPPFTQMWCAINVYRVDVSSTDSGADNPAACADGSVGSGVAAATFFDSTFCTAGTRRLLAGNQGLALLTAQAQVPEVDATVVIINSTEYGGAGGSVAFFSRHADASEIGVHELGHSAFSLADEYADLNNGWTAGEPAQANLTTITDRTTTKWADLLAAATPLPTQPNPDCTKENLAASPVPAGTVGLFEGGGRSRCGVYRPEHQCRMRTLGQPFCHVCERAIRRRLAPFMPVATGPRLGVQFTGTVPAKATQRWFTYNWPACWNVVWTVTTTTPVTPGPGLDWRVRVERSSRERITYWIDVENLTPTPIDVSGRYAIVAE